MAAKAGITFREFRRYIKALDSSKFRPVLHKHIAKANLRAAKFAQRTIRRTMKKGMPPPNAPLTIAIKGSKKPLIDKGDLFQSVATQEFSWDKIAVGVLATDANFDIAKTLHEGKLIPVTVKMRAMFFWLWVAWQAGDGSHLRGRAADLWARYQGPWYPLAPSTRAIKITGRPFITQAFADKKLQARVHDEWVRGINAAVKEVTK